jgi:hypothetical protein
LSATIAHVSNWKYNSANTLAFLIDNKLYGRKKMQIIGFMMDFILFTIPAFKFTYYREPMHIKSFQAMYFLSSFFNQFGPNAVTFLVAAEVFPTPVRATAHGFSAAVGKLGALTAGIMYNYLSNQGIFYVVPWFGLMGATVTFLFLPDTTGLDLAEAERRWRFIRSGHEEDYHGVAIHPKHLSLWERWRGVGKHYDPVLDYQQRIEEMREYWERTRAEKLTEPDNKDHKFDHAEYDNYPEGVHRYFENTSSTTSREKLLEKADHSDNSLDEKQHQL